MEVKVFATEDGALVVLPADTEISDQLLKIGALRPLGDGFVPEASLSPELVAMLSAGSPAMAQPPDVQPVLRAIAARPASQLGSGDDLSGKAVLGLDSVSDGEPR